MGLSIGQIDIVIGSELRGHKDTQHAALALVHNGRRIGHGQFRAALGDQPDGAGFLCDQHPPVRQEGQLPGKVEGRHLGHGERKAGLGRLGSQIDLGIGRRGHKGRQDGEFRELHGHFLVQPGTLRAPPR